MTSHMMTLLRRPAILALSILLLLLTSFAYWSIVIHVEVRYDEMNRARAAAQSAFSKGHLPAAEFERTKRLYKRERSRLDDESMIIRFPRAMQLMAQTTATAGGLFFGLIGALSLGSELTWRTYQHKISSGRPRRSIMLSYLRSTATVACLLVIAACVLGAVFSAWTGVSPSPIASHWNATITAIAGALLTAITWTAIGGAIAIVTRGASGAASAAAGVWIFLVMAPIFAKGIRRWLPDYLGAAVVSRGTSLGSISGLFLPGGAGDGRLVEVPVAISLLGVIAIGSALFTIRRFEVMDLE